MEGVPMIGWAQTIAQVILGLSIALSGTAQAPNSASAPAKPADEERALRAFAAIQPIDVHVHVFKTDPAFQKMLERLNVKLLKDWQSTYARDWKFLATCETLNLEGKQVHGLNLPQPVLQKMFRSNAIRWIPGL
jgi:hypothetical protein